LAKKQKNMRQMFKTSDPTWVMEQIVLCFSIHRHTSKQRRRHPRTAPFIAVAKAFLAEQAAVRVAVNLARRRRRRHAGGVEAETTTKTVDLHRSLLITFSRFLYSICFYCYHLQTGNWKLNL
jgi:hypothetical protein